jgi:hypothetical protein
VKQNTANIQALDENVMQQLTEKNKHLDELVELMKVRG